MKDVVIVIDNENKDKFYLDSNEKKYNLGDSVLFETDNGIQAGTVIKENYFEKKENLSLPLLSLLRKIDDNDINIINNNKLIADKALFFATKTANELGLEMSFVNSYISFDETHLVLSFISDNRVDFRDLAKKLAQKYKMRIELRQIGVRDRSKRIGGIGPCGLMLCCNSFLNEFNSVSINMAKNQNLALNPSKINGICGRLLCCLGYENDTYSEIKKNYPKLGSIFNNGEIVGKVVNVDIFKNKYSIELKDKSIVDFYGDLDGND